ncbi:MAG: NTP transferase domain-containing protein [Candidatus Latescibacteria bacterium]|nr:NTP transferase domain-containing protein [Candidatus Latescibacterota bacterium]
MNIAKAIVPVAGLGTRLLPTTKSLSKEMLPVGRLPVVHHVVEELAAAGIRQILFVTGRNKSAIENHFDDSSAGYRERGIEFFFAHQPPPPGTGTAVAAGEAFAADEPFVVAFGDSIVRTRSGRPLLQRMIDSHLRHRAACTIGAYEVPEEQMHHYGILVPEMAIAEDSKLTAILEKPTPAQTSSRLAVSARYVFSPAIFAHLRTTTPSPSGEVYLTDAIAALIAGGDPVRAVRLNADEQRCDIGNHLSYFTAFIDYALDDPEWGAQIHAYLREKLAGDSS